jgi:hypothetical protein
MELSFIIFYRKGCYESVVVRKGELKSMQAKKCRQSIVRGDSGGEFIYIHIYIVILFCILLCLWYMSAIFSKFTIFSF